MRCEQLANFPTGRAPCGQCKPCRVNKKRAWAARIGLELAAHAASSFLTLTYNVEHLPEKPVREHLSLFMRYLRRRIGKVRFFAVAELGERRGRPHYHVILFGVPATLEMESACQKAWSRGYVQLKEVRDQGAAEYVCKYMLKAQDSEQRLPDGMSVTWSLMSRQPGIGNQTLKHLADKLESRGIGSASHLGIDSNGATWDATTKITSGGCVRLDGRLRPLDKYSKNILFPEKEGSGVARLKTLRSKRVAREGGSFSEVEQDARRLLEDRLRARAAIAKARRTTL